MVKKLIFDWFLFQLNFQVESFDQSGNSLISVRETPNCARGIQNGSQLLNYRIELLHPSPLHMHPALHQEKHWTLMKKMFMKIWFHCGHNMLLRFWLFVLDICNSASNLTVSVSIKAYLLMWWSSFHHRSCHPLHHDHDDVLYYTIFYFNFFMLLMIFLVYYVFSVVLSILHKSPGGYNVINVQLMQIIHRRHNMHDMHDIGLSLCYRCDAPLIITWLEFCKLCVAVHTRARSTNL